MDIIIGIAAFSHLVLSPFTKVEESFNMQAAHDILYHNVNVEQYDHLQFPGVVPRTFLGPLTLSSISLPFHYFFMCTGISKLWSQYIIRFTLATLVILAWREFRMQLQSTFGKTFAIWFTLITASQFHFIYYLSRTLPNIFALIFALLSYKYWLQQHHKNFLICSGIGVIIFRFELCLLLGPILVFDLVRGSISFIRLLRSGIPIGLLCLLATVIVDSFFWRRLLWPEGEVLWFNTYQNKSHHWGVYPFFWYWYSCLPRALGLSILFVVLGAAIDKRIRMLLCPALVFVGLYSFLPHKELRFIIYVIPLFNAAAAKGCQFVWVNRTKTLWQKAVAFATCVHLLGNFVFTSLLLYISMNNYPGGNAMVEFHQVVHSTQEVNLHIDNMAAQSGVTRFTELYPHWRYNKTENLKAGGAEIRTFSHLLVEAKSKHAYNLKHYAQSHRILGSVDAFSHLSHSYFSWPPLKVRLKPSIFILENLNWSEISQLDDEKNPESF